MAIDITNHLIPYTTVKQMLATAWDEGYAAGMDEGQGATIIEANPYRDN